MKRKVLAIVLAVATALTSVGTPVFSVSAKDSRPVETDVGAPAISEEMSAENAGSEEARTDDVSEAQKSYASGEPAEHGARNDQGDSNQQHHDPGEGDKL